MKPELEELVRGVESIKVLSTSSFNIYVECMEDDCPTAFGDMLYGNIRRDLPLTLSKTKTQYNELAGKASLQAITEMLK